MDGNTDAFRHLIDVSAILALGVVYVTVLSLGSTWRSLVGGVSSIRSFGDSVKRRYRQPTKPT